MNSIQAGHGDSGIQSSSKDELHERKKSVRLKRSPRNKTPRMSDRHSHAIHSVEAFQKKYKVKELVFNSHAGLFESYLCETKTTTNTHDKTAPASSTPRQCDKVYL